MSTNANDFLFGSSTASAKFPTIGTTVTGTIAITPTVEQQRDLDGNPKSWESGDPMMQLIVTLQTAELDNSVADDDGRRRLYVKGKSLTDAVRNAVKSSGSKGLEVGGTLSVTYIGDGEQTKRGYSAPKLYSATYQAPTAAAANEFLGVDTPEPAAAAPAPAAATPIDEAKQLIAAGIEDDSVISAATNLPVKVIAALRNAAVPF